MLTQRLGVAIDEDLRNRVVLSLFSRALRSISAYMHHNEMQAKHAPVLHLVCCPSSDCIWPWRRLPLCCPHRLALHISESARLLWGKRWVVRLLLARIMQAKGSQDVSRDSNYGLNWEEIAPKGEPTTTEVIIFVLKKIMLHEHQ